MLTHSRAHTRAHAPSRLLPRMTSTTHTRPPSGASRCRQLTWPGTLGRRASAVTGEGGGVRRAARGAQRARVGHARAANARVPTTCHAGWAADTRGAHVQTHTAAHAHAHAHPRTPAHTHAPTHAYVCTRRRTCCLVGARAAHVVIPKVHQEALQRAPQRLGVRVAAWGWLLRVVGGWWFGWLVGLLA
jgi:hypothetical protein